jgi:general secretion pathway protein L
MSHLLISLPTPGPVSPELAYALLNTAGQVSAQGQATAALLPKAAQVSVLLPPQVFSWHRVNLPKLPRSLSPQKLHTLLAGLLEEHLLDEPAQLHLALWPTPATAGPAWVCACDKAWLMQQMQSLQEAGVYPSAILPQAMPVAEAAPPLLHVSGDPDQAWVTYSDAQGVIAVPFGPDNASAQGLQALPAPSVSSSTSAEWVCTSLPGTAALAEARTGLRFHVIPAAQAAEQAFTRATAARLNLAQGPLASLGKRSFMRSLWSGLGQFFAAPQWRPARWGLALLVLAQLVGLNVWAWRESSKIQAKQQAMAQLLTQSFPNVKVVVDAPVQMQRELQALRQSRGQVSGSDFESLYGRFSQVMGGELLPTLVEYKSSEVSVQGLMLAATQMEQLAPKLQYAGIALRTQGSSLLISDRASPRAVEPVKP